MPAVARSKKPTSPRRRSLLAKVHIAKKQLGLNDDEYRDLLEGMFNVRSSSKLSDKRLVELIEYFKTQGFRDKPNKARSKPQNNAVPASAKEARPKWIAKLRAVWISLYYLGVVRDRSDKALTAMVRRVSGGKDTGIQSLQWIDEQAAYLATEALKKMAEREAEVNWSAYRILDPRSGQYATSYRPRARVVEAQWDIMCALDLVRIKNMTGRAEYARRVVKEGAKKDVSQMTADQQDTLIQTFGSKIRAELKVRGFDDLKSWREAS